MHIVGKNRPDFVTYGVTELKKFYIININITESGDGFEWDSIVTKPGDMFYGEIVSDIIRLNYSDDEMIAIINNYLDDMENQTYLTKFKEMQSWRKFSKQTAKDSILWAIDNNIYEVTPENEWVLEENNNESAEYNDIGGE